MNDELRKRLQVVMAEVSISDGDMMPFLMDNVDEFPEDLQDAVDRVLDGHDDGSELDALLTREYMPSVYDIIPDFGSYIMDTERNLSGDHEEWSKYKSDPVPYIKDVLLDFGLWKSFDASPEVVRVLAQMAAEKYWPSKYTWSPKQGVCNVL